MSNPLWHPDEERVKQLTITRFQQQLGLTGDYADFHAYSVHSKAEFWSAVWDETGIIGEKGSQILQDEDKMPGASWFSEARLNFAENLLRYDDDQVALISRLENGERRALSYKDLHQQVAGVANWLTAQGVEPGDRVAAFMPNVPETVVLMLAASSLGATFSSCSPDFGLQGVIDRFGQIEPKVLMACNGYYYGDKVLDVRERVHAMVAALPVTPVVIGVKVIDGPLPENASDFELVSKTANASSQAQRFPRFPFDHPLYIMYSSGTTGKPKCIVHGVGGTLIQHRKEHHLHCDLKRSDKIFYYSTCGWMMWNWLVSGLAAGATVVLYDGSPFHPQQTVLMDLAEQEAVTVFGTSARYLASLQKMRIQPVKTHNLEAMRTILSTGSPLSPASFDYVYRDIKADVHLASISGGTDIVSCFVLGHPGLPVYRGELQCAGLGMDVKVYSESAESVVGVKGELVCASPFPSMPTGFWQDEGDARYLDAYFSRFQGIWAQGDYAEATANGGFVIHGRSDAVLNPGGVRIGTAEIYRQVDKIPEVLESVCVGQAFKDDVRVILCVMLAPGLHLDSDLVKKIKATIRSNTTPRHVPARIYAVPDIPRTRSGKIVELAVADIMNGRPVKNTEALANPDALDAFRRLV